MRIHPIKGIVLLVLLLVTASLPAQKHVEAYDPEALFNDGVLLFQNQEYGAALAIFPNTVPKLPTPSLSLVSTRNITRRSVRSIWVKPTVQPKSSSL